MMSDQEYFELFRRAVRASQRRATEFRRRAAAAAPRLAERARLAAPYVAETGLAVFGAAAFLIAVLALLEFDFPGLVAPYIAPQVIVSVLVLGGLAALVGPAREERGRLVRLLPFAYGIPLAVAAGAAAWYYFSPMPAAPWLAFAAALAAGVPCWILL